MLDIHDLSGFRFPKSNPYRKLKKSKKPGISDRRNTYTWSQVSEKIKKWWKLFEDIGVSTNARIGLLSGNTAEAHIFYLAAMGYASVGAFNIRNQDVSKVRMQKAGVNVIFTVHLDDSYEYYFCPGGSGKTQDKEVGFMPSGGTTGGFEVLPFSWKLDGKNKWGESLSTSYMVNRYLDAEGITKDIVNPCAPWIPIGPQALAMAYYMGSHMYCTEDPDEFQEASEKIKPGIIYTYGVNYEDLVRNMIHPLKSEGKKVGIITAGYVDPDLCDRIRHWLGVTDFLNLYGRTESWLISCSINNTESVGAPVILPHESFHVNDDGMIITKGLASGGKETETGDYVEIIDGEWYLKRRDQLSYVNKKGAKFYPQEIEVKIKSAIEGRFYMFALNGDRSMDGMGLCYVAGLKISELVRELESFLGRGEIPNKIWHLKNFDHRDMSSYRGKVGRETFLEYIRENPEMVIERAEMNE